MREFKLVEGGKSPHYNYFEDMELSSCRATATRLMGVVAIRNVWRNDKGDRLYQIMHLDYSEYGIDEYMEFVCRHGDIDFSKNRNSAKECWKHFVSVMGGEASEIDPKIMLKLIDSAKIYAGDNITREYDNDENIKFRHYALSRLGKMQKVLEGRGISSEDVSSFMALDAVSLNNLGQYASINYFLMRLVDLDFEAAAFLSDISEDELKNFKHALHGPGSLIRNSIRKIPKKDNPRASDKLRMYDCKMTYLAMDSYYHATLGIWLEGGTTSKDALVKDMQLGTITRLSDYESAVQIARPEYISVFTCGAKMRETFDIAYISPFKQAVFNACPNGRLYTIYNPTNSHVENSEYRLGDDVFGYALMSYAGELVLMSHNMYDIKILDDAVLFSAYAPYVQLDGRYRLDDPVYQTICQTPGILFEDLIDAD